MRGPASDLAPSVDHLSPPAELNASRERRVPDEQSRRQMERNIQREVIKVEISEDEGSETDAGVDGHVQEADFKRCEDEDEREDEDENEDDGDASDSDDCGSMVDNDAASESSSSSSSGSSDIAVPPTVRLPNRPLMSTPAVWICIQVPPSPSPSISITEEESEEDNPPPAVLKRPHPSVDNNRPSDNRKRPRIYADLGDGAGDIGSNVNFVTRSKPSTSYATQQALDHGGQGGQGTDHRPVSPTVSHDDVDGRTREHVKPREHPRQFISRQAADPGSNVNESSSSLHQPENHEKDPPVRTFLSDDCSGLEAHPIADILAAAATTPYSCAGCDRKTPSNFERPVTHCAGQISWPKHASSYFFELITVY